MNIIETVIFLLSFLGIGKLFQMSRFYSKSVSDNLNHILIYFTSPILILYTFVWSADRSELSEMSNIVISSFLITTIMLFISFISASFISDKKISGVFVISSTYSNTLFFGLPIILAFFGDDGLLPLVVYSMSHFAWHIIFGTVACTYYSGSDMNFKEVFREIISFPPFLATILGLILLIFDFQLEISFLESIFYYIGHLTSPVALVMFGMSLSLKIVHKFAFFLTLIYKFVILIIITVFVIFILNLETLSTKVIFFESLMPPAIFNFILTKRYNLDEEFATSTIFTLTLISFPILMFFGLILV